jgi:hypothetical protein
MSTLAIARTLATSPAATAMMLAAARHKAETNVKNVSADRAKAEEKSKVTLDLAKGTITGVDVPVDDFAQTQQDAYDKPYRELEKVAAPLMELLKSQGQKLDRDKIKQELSTPEGRLRAARNEFDYNPISARLWGRRQIKNLPENEAVDRVVMERAKRFAGLYAGLSPIVDDLRMGASKATEAQKAAAAAQTAARKALFSDIGKADLEMLTVEGIAARTGIPPEALEADDEIMKSISDRRTKLTVAKAKDSATVRRKAVADLKREVVDGGQTFEQWREDTESQVGPLSSSEVSRARAKWRSFEKKITDERVEKQRASEDQRMQVERFEKAMTPKPEKPTVPKGNWTTDDIITANGDASVDQNVLGRLANGRLTSIARDMQTNVDEAKSVDAEIAALERVAEEDRTVRQDVRLETLQVKRRTLAEANTRLRSEKEALREAGFGGRRTQLKVGDTKTFPNGRVGRWDGRGWVLVSGN